MKFTEKKILLNGKWEYLEDKDGELSYEYLLNSFKKKRTKKMELPVNWELAGLHNFSGTVWFIKSFNSHRPGGLEILEFKGVDYFCDAWLNDVYLGNHEGYFQSFYFDVTSSLKKGENLLIVKVTSPLEEPGSVWPYKKRLIKGIFNHHDCRPGAWNERFGQDQNTGGVWNDVTLISGNGTYTENPRILTRVETITGRAVVNVVIPFYSRINTARKEEIEILVSPPEGKKIRYKKNVSLDGPKNEINFTFEINHPVLWWCWDLGEPNLYSMDIESESFSIRGVTFGIREIFLNNKNEFFLNGKRLFLRGTNVIPTQFLSELNTQKIREQIRLISEANVNIIRMHAHVNRSEYYDECDRAGILVWQDFALQWTYDDSHNFIYNAVSQIKDMVKLHYNHPSIVFWCCHNEPGIK